MDRFNYIMVLTHVYMDLETLATMIEINQYPALASVCDRVIDEKISELLYLREHRLCQENKELAQK